MLYKRARGQTLSHSNTVWINIVKEDPADILLSAGSLTIWGMHELMSESKVLCGYFRKLSVDFVRIEILGSVHYFV